MEKSVYDMSMLTESLFSDATDVSPALHQKRRTSKPKKFTMETTVSLDSEIRTIKDSIDMHIFKVGFLTKEQMLSMLAKLQDFDQAGNKLTKKCTTLLNGLLTEIETLEMKYATPQSLQMNLTEDIEAFKNLGNSYTSRLEDNVMEVVFNNQCGGSVSELDISLLTDKNFNTQSIFQSTDSIASEEVTKIGIKRCENASVSLLQDKRFKISTTSVAFDYDLDSDATKICSNSFLQNSAEEVIFKDITNEKIRCFKPRRTLSQASIKRYLKPVTKKPSCNGKENKHNASDLVTNADICNQDKISNSKDETIKKNNAPGRISVIEQFVFEASKTLIANDINIKEQTMIEKTPDENMKDENECDDNYVYQSSATDLAFKARIEEVERMLTEFKSTTLIKIDEVSKRNAESTTRALAQEKRMSCVPHSSDTSLSDNENDEVNRIRNLHSLKKYASIFKAQYEP